MKKNYIIPAIETQILSASLMQTGGGGSPANNNVGGEPSTDPDGAPKRRVLY